MIIYKATNNINNKIYIGQTKRNLYERIAEHCRATDSCYFHNALRKYGIQNFIFEIIDTANSVQELNAKEMYWISYYNSSNRNFGYNSTFGGDDNPMNHTTTRSIHDNIMRSEEVRKKISDTMKRKYQNGELFSVEQRKKLSAVQANCIYINKEGITSRIHKYDLEKYLNDGWVIGNGQKLHNRRDGRHIRSVAVKATVDSQSYFFPQIRSAHSWYLKYKGVSITYKSFARALKRSIVNNNLYGGIMWCYISALEYSKEVGDNG